MQATKVSADGEQTAADAERSRKAAEELELYVRNTLLAAEGTHTHPHDKSHSHTQRMNHNKVYH